MRENTLSRRTFLRNAASAATLSATHVSLGSTNQVIERGARGGRALRLGGPIFVKSDDPAVLAHAHRALGYCAA